VDSGPGKRCHFQLLQNHHKTFHFHKPGPFSRPVTQNVSPTKMDSMNTTNYTSGKRLHHATSIAAITIALTFSVSLAGCSFTRHAIAALRSTDHFMKSQVDYRVFYESGAEAYAEKVASFLSSAVQHVEKRQYGPFVKPVRVYVCASRKSFVKLYGADTRAGVLLKLFLSPRVFEHGDEIANMYLMHELSHLHLLQHLGSIKMSRVPSWFKEGLATYVSNGGGANLVSQKKAEKFIREGKYFIPHETGGLIFKKNRSDFNLHHHMFYRQSMMFVSFLVAMDSLKFKKLLRAVEDGESFSSSVHEAYNQSLDELWIGFLGKIKEKG
jgi:hypothetical protein